MGLPRPSRLRAATAALAVLVAMPSLLPGAGATHEAVDPLAGVAASAQDSLVNMVDTFARMGGDAASQLATGPAAGVGATLEGSLATIRSGSSQAERTLVALGDGTATFQLSSGTGSCSPMQALVEHHDPVSNEPNLMVNFAGAQGNPVLICSTGWRFAFKPTEVQGTPEEGLTAYRLSPDAEIWLTLGAPDGLGHRSLGVLHITILGDVLGFQGTVTDLL